MRVTATAWDGPPPEPGEYLATNAGSVYLLTDVRPGRVNPWVADAVRLVKDAAVAVLLDPDEVVYGWKWNARGRGQ